MIEIGNAPCSWGVEFADDPRNPTWQRVLADCAAAGYRGIELGPIGFMPEDPAVLGDGLAQHGLTLIGGVVFRPFHDPNAWDELQDAAQRTCRALVSHGAKHLVLIDSISARRAPTAGRAAEAEQMGTAEWAAFVQRFREIAKMGTDHGLTVGVHAHAAHQGGHMAPPHSLPLVPQQIAQHTGAGKRIPQMEFVDPPHQRQRRLGYRRWVVIGGRAGQFQ